MNKYFFGLFAVLGLALAAAVSPAQATVGVRSPKAVYQNTPLTATTAVIISSGPTAVYQVVQSTGASGEFITLCDTASVTGVTSQVNNTANSVCKVHLMYGSTTANTVTTFDPPLMFFNGLAMIGSATTGQAMVTYEVGRALTGQ